MDKLIHMVYPQLGHNLDQYGWGWSKTATTHVPHVPHVSKKLCPSTLRQDNATSDQSTPGEGTYKSGVCHVITWNNPEKLGWNQGFWHHLAIFRVDCKSMVTKQVWRTPKRSNFLLLKNFPNTSSSWNFFQLVVEQTHVFNARLFQHTEPEPAPSYTFNNLFTGFTSYL